ncbi:MAG TPA: nitronate monooxygenase family protein [Kofleriaceae bacterium]|jgi:nitronate monooxygenase|nr:nitronate monooxygenase family protein [Kofleriaceae bacterium]
MTLPTQFGRLRIPVVGAPMFIVSQPALVIAQCKAGIVGAFPALNARPAPVLRTWITQIRAELAAWDAAHPEAPSAPFAVNQIVHKSNDRLEQDLAVCVEERVPIIITSLGARDDLNRAIHGYGGLVLHDITNIAHAEKALERGADGLIAVCAGAGGHAGTLSPFALVQEIRRFFQGPLALSGAIANGRSILAARAMGADLAYVGSAFIATLEANAPSAYKDAVVAGSARDIVYTNLFSGVHANYLRSSIVAAGLDPDRLPTSDPTAMSFASKDDGATPIKRWRDIWGSGQGIGAIQEILATEALVARLEREYREAREALE